MFMKPTLLFTSAVLLLTVPFSAYAMLEKEKEKPKSISIKIDTKQVEIKPEYLEAPQKDPLVENYITVVNDQIIVGKKNEFALFYDKENNKTTLFQSIDTRGIVNIDYKIEDLFYIEYEDEEKEYSTPDGCAGGNLSRSEEKDVFKKLEGLKISQQMEKLEKLEKLWKPLDEKKTIFSMEYEGSLYLSQIVDEKLYFFVKADWIQKELDGQFFPVSCPESSQGKGEWILASKNQVVSFQKTARDVGKTFLIGDLKDVDLKIKKEAPRKDINSEFILYGDNNSSYIDNLTSLNNISISELESTMAPNNTSNNGSYSGFLGKDEPLLKVMVAQNEEVKMLGLKHEELVEPLKEIVAAYEQGWISANTTFLFHENIFSFEVLQTKGLQYSPFYDDIPPASRKIILSNLTLGKSLRFSPMVPHMAGKYGFYEGNVPCHVPPKQIVELFPWLLNKKK